MADGIKGLPEIFDYDFGRERQLYFQSRKEGLGPDDLIQIERMFDHKERTYHHMVCGKMIASVESFLEYITEVKKRLQTPNRTRILFTSASIYNSFTGKDAILFECDDKVTLVSTTYSSDQINLIEDSEWKQLRLSSMLRFYRGSVPLYSSLYPGSDTQYPFLFMYQPEKFSIEELRYIAKHHPPSEELQLALANCLLTTLQSKEIIKFLYEFIGELSLIPCFIIQNIPHKSYFAECVYCLIEDRLISFPDDVESATHLFKYFLEVGNLQKCLLYAHILIGVSYKSREACILLSKLCALVNRFEDALCFLNEATFISSEKVERILSTSEEMETTLPTGAVTLTPSRTELRVSKNSFNDPKKLLFEAFLDLLLTTEGTIIEDEIKNYVPSHEPSDFMKLQPFKSSSTQYISKHLYDPGILFDLDLIIDRIKLPLTEEFEDAFAYANAVKNTYTKLLKGTARLNNDLIGNMIIAFKTRDPKLLKRLFSLAFQQRMLSGTIIVLMYRAMQIGLTPESKEVTQAMPIHPSLSESNSILLARLMYENTKHLL